MPPKDDDDPASTKEVVTKKQKQLLNREELDLNLIAESLGGYVVSEEITSLTGDPKEIIKRIFKGVPKVDAGPDPRDLSRFLPDPESKVENPKSKGGGPRVNPLSKKAADAKFLRSLGTPEELAAAEQQAAIDQQADKASGKRGPQGPRPTPRKRFDDLSKAIKNVKPSSVGRVVRGAGRLAAPAYAAVDIAGRSSRGQSTTQAVAAPVGGVAGSKLGAKLGASIMAPVPIPGARIAGAVVGGGIGYATGAGLVDKMVDFFKPKVKPVKPPKVKPAPEPEVEPTPQREVEPKRKPNQKPNTPGSGVKTPSRTNVGSDKTKTPDKTKSPDGLTGAQTAIVGGTALTAANALKGGKKGGGGRLPGFGVPQQPRGKIGRRQNPQ